jgi:hypothetical protein
MADRYWVGGSGNWNSTSKWSTTSGGASGASVPTSADNAIFDASSGAAHFTVTVTANATCANLTLTPVAADGVTIFQVANGFVIAGTFSTSGTQGNRRFLFRTSDYGGLTYDVSIATIGTVSDVDFSDIRITGAGGTLSGTRIGNLGGCKNITFSTPKTVYWVTLAGGNWSGNNWSNVSAGTASTDNFPLAQDTAIVDNAGLNTSATITFNTGVIFYCGSINMSSRTNAMTFTQSGSVLLVFGDWRNGTGVTLTSGAVTPTFQARSATQVITSAGEVFGDVSIYAIGGTVELTDALNLTGRSLTFFAGTFDTKNFNITCGTILSGDTSFVKTVKLGSSTITVNGGAPEAIDLRLGTNLTIDAGTSQINMSAAGVTFYGGGQTFRNVSFSGTSVTTVVIGDGGNTFNNLTINSPGSVGIRRVEIAANQTINGTLTVAGATVLRRVFVKSDVYGSGRTLTVATLAATNCDFQDITIAGAAAGSTPTRAGDCGGNSGIVFTSKTVYWNLAGAQNWSATGWAPSSGGTVDINQFPLAQDTAVFDNTGSAGTVTINSAWNIGTVDASARTTAMTLSVGTNTPDIFGDWKWGSGVTSTSSAGTLNFTKRGTQTITSNGITFGCNITIDSFNGNTQLADALTLNTARALSVLSGTFDAVSYNVTTGRVSVTTDGISVFTRAVKMGSATWTITSTGTVWDGTDVSGFALYIGTATITLSNTTTTARTFITNGVGFGKITIGGATGTSTLNISGIGHIAELASTKTVAHTIAFDAPITFGKWSVTGTVGNVVTITGDIPDHVLAGAATSGINYLAMGATGFASTSPGEFYAGVNSTGTAGAPVYRTAPPAARTLYWVGGTGNWSSTTSWSTSSGGASGAAIPTSLDDVVFDSASNATAYTSTVDATSRCNKLTVAGPASGNVTFAGTARLILHDDVSLAATGITRTFTGPIVLSGSTTGKSFTSNGVTLNSTITVDGVSSEWTLGSALNNSSNIVNIKAGLLDCDTYNLTAGSITANTNTSKTIDFGSSTISLSSGSFIDFGSSGNLEEQSANLSVIVGTSQINASAGNPNIYSNSKTFYNVAFTSTSAGTVSIVGATSFNNLSFTGITASGLKIISLNANQTVTGTLTCSAGTDATMRHFIRSDTLGTTRTITAAAVSLTDVDFRDITIAGAAAPATGTRIGDCKGNSGITFTAAANKYWNLAGGGNWGGAIAWATSSGGSPSINNFPLAQDTCFIENTGLNASATVTINVAYNIGTVDMSGRTTAMTLASNVNPVIYGNWVNGSGTALSGTGTLTFSGRTSQTLTSAGKTFTQSVTVDSLSGTVTLQDAFTTNRSLTGALTITNGTFDAGTYNVTLSSGSVVSNNSNTRTIAIGSGTWTVAGSGGWNATTATGLTVTGTGTITLTSASSKTFAGGDAAYTNVTVNQGGAGTLTITGNNTFKDITNTYKSTGSTTISLGATTQRVSQWTAAGEAARLLTLSGTSAASPATLILTGATDPSVDYLSIANVRAYSLDTTWYAGTNSTNNGSLGWYFEAGAPVVSGNTNFFFFLRW